MLDGISFVVCGGPVRRSAIRFFADWIELQRIPKYEILWIGAKPFDALSISNLRYIEFDEFHKGKPWVTKKKNIGTQEARYDTIVYMHDYLHLDGHWYLDWCEFDESFDVAMNCVLMEENGEVYRHSDWLVEPYELWKFYPECTGKFWDLSLPYNLRGMTKVQYISGGYWVAKKEFMLANPLNEALTWGEEEDLEWSRRVRQKTEFVMNADAMVWITKEGKWKPGPLPTEYLDRLIKENNLSVTWR